MLRFQVRTTIVQWYVLLHQHVIGTFRKACLIPCSVVALQIYEEVRYKEDPRYADAPTSNGVHELVDSESS